MDKKFQACVNEGPSSVQFINHIPAYQASLHVIGVAAAPLDRALSEGCT
jgi:hypothetical protein